MLESCKTFIYAWSFAKSLHQVIKNDTLEFDCSNASSFLQPKDLVVQKLTTSNSSLLQFLSKKSFEKILIHNNSALQVKVEIIPGCIYQKFTLAQRWPRTFHVEGFQKSSFRKI